MYKLIFHKFDQQQGQYRRSWSYLFDNEIRPWNCFILFVENFEDEFLKTVPVKGHTETAHLVQHTAQCPHVTLVIIAGYDQGLRQGLARSTTSNENFHFQSQVLKVHTHVFSSLLFKQHCYNHFKRNRPRKGTCTWLNLILWKLYKFEKLC